jgi:hypothetical protein
LAFSSVIRYLSIRPVILIIGSLMISITL